MASFFALCGITAVSLAAGYAWLSLVAAVSWHFRRTPATPATLPPVTVLKPLCGSEAGLYERLRSFCLQDYPDFQIVFGVRDPLDPALVVVKRLIAELPQLAIDVVVNPQQHGSNLKMSNLVNMLVQARHDIVVMSDSDTHVGPDYLATVTAPLLDCHVGLVTCLYRGVPTPGIWSRLGAMYANEWFVPSVLVARLIGFTRYAFGQSLATRRSTLDAIGGLQAVADHLADDYMLGELVRGLGLRVVLSPYMLDVQHDEVDLASLARHELRWMRTTRVLRPWNSRFIFLTFSLPLATLGALLAATEPALAATAWGLFWVTAALRLALHFVQPSGAGRSPLSDIWLLPFRDLLTCYVWCRSFTSSRVSWRGSEFDVRTDGIMRRLF